MLSQLADLGRAFLKDTPVRQSGAWKESGYCTELVWGHRVPPAKEENKERTDTSGQNSLGHGVKVMERRLRGQERLVKPRSKERSNRRPLGSAPDCSRLYIGNCKMVIKTD